MAQTFKLARLPVRRTVSRSVPTSRNTIVTRFRFHGSRSSFTPEMCKECARPVQDHGAQLEYQPPCGARAARSVYTIRPIPRRATSTETPTGTTTYSFQPARSPVVFFFVLHTYSRHLPPRQASHSTRVVSTYLSHSFIHRQDLLGSRRDASLRGFYSGMKEGRCKDRPYLLGNSRAYSGRTLARSGVHYFRRDNSTLRGPMWELSILFRISLIYL